MSRLNSISSKLSNSKVALYSAVTMAALSTSPVMADTDNGGTTLMIPTAITGDEVSGTLGFFDLVQNTMYHYATEYIVPLVLAGIGISWIFFALFIGNRKAKGSVAN